MARVKIDWGNKVFVIEVLEGKVYYDYPFSLLRNERAFFSQILGHRWATWQMEDDLIEAVVQVKKRKYV
jgi:hypothetical protein